LIIVRLDTTDRAKYIERVFMANTAIDFKSAKVILLSDQRVQWLTGLTIILSLLSGIVSWADSIHWSSCAYSAKPPNLSVDITPLVIPVPASDYPASPWRHSPLIHSRHWQASIVVDDIDPRPVLNEHPGGMYLLEMFLQDI
jgi:hypothetical protein